MGRHNYVEPIVHYLEYLNLPHPFRETAIYLQITTVMKTNVTCKTCLNHIAREEPNQFSWVVSKTQDNNISGE